MENITMEIAQYVAMGIPAGVVFLRHLTQIVNILNRSVSALERIAERLENADYVKLSPPNIREVR